MTTERPAIEVSIFISSHGPQGSSLRSISVSGELAEILLRQAAAALGIGRAQTLGEVGFGMRTDPGHQQETPIHDECRDLRFFLAREPRHLAIALQPRLNQVWHIGTMLDEAERGAEVIEIPADPAIIEIDDLGAGAVDQEIGEADIRMAEAEPLARLAIAFETPADHSFHAAENIER